MTCNFRIRALRESKGWTQRELAVLLGLDKSAVAHWETGRKTPTTGNLLAMARVFNCTLDALCGREPPDATAS